MTHLADLHVHLLAALDDGPRTWDDALAMCRILVEEGVSHSVALAHQSDRWVLSPETIREAVAELKRRLALEAIPLEIVPAAEVMATPDLVPLWSAGKLLSIADHRQFLLVEMPHRLFVDLRAPVRQLARLGVRVILAHPERHEELLHESGHLEELIALGCIVQVSSESITDPKTTADSRALRSWFRRGCVHVLGSDGHSPRKRKPHLAAAAQRVREWVGVAAAERICSSNGLALLRGEKLRVPKPQAERSWWPLRLIGA